MVRLRFEQQGLHVGVAGNACCLGLHSLSASYLQAFGRGVRVERHVLRFEGCRMIAVLPEDAAEGGGYDALADIAARANEHDGMKLLHI